MNHSIDSGIVLNERYRISRQLGHSSVGRTYLVEDTHRFSELCVVKELIPQLQNPEQLQKIEELFEREAKVLYKLQHPQIPRFRELFRLQNRLFLVQDYVHGQTYADLLNIRQMQGQAFTEEEVTQLLSNILPVLAYIHARGIIHRDICPGNIILRHSDRLPVLIDFGSVKQLATTGTHPVSSQPLTIAIATQLGQMGYAPPEQIQSGLVFPHSDLYALAATILVLLTGKQPNQILEVNTLTWDWKKDLALSPKFKSLLSLMLAKNATARPQNTQEILKILNQAESPYLKAPASSQPTQATLVVAPAVSPPSSDSPVITTPVTPTTTSSPTPPQLNSLSGTSSRPQSVSQKNSTMTPTSTRIGNPLNGCLGKLMLVLLLSVGSGTMGWLAGKTWLDRITQGNKNLDSTTVFTDNPASTSGISDRELKRKNEIQTRRLDLGINSQYFYSLVDRLFHSQYPSQQGKNLTNKPEDEQWREKWDKIAAELLDKLSFLNEEARQQLGQYEQSQLDIWKQQVNQLHLSSRALYDLADATFFYYFPDQENQDFVDKPLGQVWYATIYNKLQELESREIYEKIEIDSQQLETQSSGTLEPGEGKAYVVRLEAAKNLKIQLEADRDTLLSIYSPTGKNNLLEDSQETEWSGVLPEDGFYEFTIVSKAKKPLDYKLTITEDNSFLKPAEN